MYHGFLFFLVRLYIWCRPPATRPSPSSSQWVGSPKKTMGQTPWVPDPVEGQEFYQAPGKWLAWGAFWEAIGCYLSSIGSVNCMRVAPLPEVLGRTEFNIHCQTGCQTRILSVQAGSELSATVLPLDKWICWRPSGATNVLRLFAKREHNICHLEIYMWYLNASANENDDFSTVWLCYCESSCPPTQVSGKRQPERLRGFG